MPHSSAAPDARCRRYAWVLGGLTALFGLRIAGQALQRWHPVDLLPPFNAFQTSAMPYWLLLGIELLMIALMASITRDVAAGTRRRNPAAARVLGWLGTIYLAGSIARIGVGLALPDASPWFTAWIPAFFHVVLAALVLALSAYHSTARRGRAAPEVA